MSTHKQSHLEELHKLRKNILTSKFIPEELKSAIALQITHSKDFADKHWPEDVPSEVPRGAREEDWVDAIDLRYEMVAALAFGG